MTTKVDTDQIGTVRYYKDGVHHREDGPAAIYASGTQKWYRNGYCHREDGPAVIWSDGTCRWCWFDTGYSFDEWCEKANITDQQKTILMLKYNV